MLLGRAMSFELMGSYFAGDNQARSPAAHAVESPHVAACSTVSLSSARPIDANLNKIFFEPHYWREPTFEMCMCSLSVRLTSIKQMMC
jgi:hypothetical protein